MCVAVHNFSFCFNPRTRKGCDHMRQKQLTGMTCFNPRTRKGCDFLRLEKSYSIIVSIHAPVKDATDNVSN